MAGKKHALYLQKRSKTWRWLLVGFLAVLVLLRASSLLANRTVLHGSTMMVDEGLRSTVCPKPCLDAVIPYHEADQSMFVRNGGLFAAKRHLTDVRHFHVVSVSNQTFVHLLDERTRWYDEALVPFYGLRAEEQVSGWKYQQALKLWAVQHIPGLCNNVLVLDADVLWIKDFEVVVPTSADTDGSCTVATFNYNIATPASGAWESDIYSTSYHAFVEYFTGLPKMNQNVLTAINHWQVMQRDVLVALGKSLAARTHLSIETAMLEYGGTDDYDMTEYEAYFSFVSYFFPDRVQAISLPYVIRQPRFCDYSDASTLSSFEGSPIAYLTCHDKYDRDDFYVNCKGKQCGKERTSARV